MALIKKLSDPVHLYKFVPHIKLSSERKPNKRFAWLLFTVILEISTLFWQSIKTNQVKTLIFIQVFGVS